MSEPFKFPEQIQGWLTQEEGQALYRHASGKRVLELGSWRGRSTVCMAQSAESVLAVDHFGGDAGIEAELKDVPDAATVRSEFFANVAGYENVGLQECATDKAEFTPNSFDFVFVDGAHDYESAKRDMEVAKRAVKDGGTIALHDWTMDSVRRAAVEALGWETTSAAEYVASQYGLYIRKYEQNPVRPSVMIAVPHRGDVSSGTVTGIINAMGSREANVVH